MSTTVGHLPTPVSNYLNSKVNQDTAKAMGIGWLPQVQWAISAYNNKNPYNMNKNVKAFLDLIAWCEGTKGRGEDGYNIMFGGKTFSNGYKDHPRIPHRYGKVWTSAAGRYQFMAKTTKTRLDTWGECVKALGLKDFSPASQDKAAIYLITRRGALDEVQAGKIKKACDILCEEWASLPGPNDYNQPQRSLTNVIKKFVEFGGTLAK